MAPPTVTPAVTNCAAGSGIPRIAAFHRLPSDHPVGTSLGPCRPVTTWARRERQSRSFAEATAPQVIMVESMDLAALYGGEKR